MKRSLRIVKRGLMMEDMELLLVGRMDTFAPWVERFARMVYYRRYGAKLNTFCRELLTLWSRNYGVISCVGINTPESGEIFLEQYLDRPVEEEVSRVTVGCVKRDEIVEVGTMAVYEGGLCRLMMAGLVGLLVEQNKRFIVCTAVKTLRNTFNRLSIPYLALAKATPERLKSGVGDWGSYYNASPEVILIDLMQCWKQIDRVLKNLNNHLSPDMAELMKEMFVKGISLVKNGNAHTEGLRCSYGGL